MHVKAFLLTFMTTGAFSHRVSKGKKYRYLGFFLWQLQDFLRFKLEHVWPDWLTGWLTGLARNALKMVTKAMDTIWSFPAIQGLCFYEWFLIILKRKIGKLGYSRIFFLNKKKIVNENILSPSWTCVRDSCFQSKENHMPNVNPQKVFQFLSVMNAPVYAEAVTTPTMGNLWNVTMVKRNIYFIFKKKKCIHS